MRETLGWICLGIGVICSITVLSMESKGISHTDSYGTDSFFEQEDRIHEKTSKKRGYKLVVFVGLFFIGLGMYLIGMFAK